MVMYEQIQVGVAEGHPGDQFADADYDRLDGQGQDCAADIRAKLLGLRDDQGIDLSEVLGDTTTAAQDRLRRGYALASAVVSGTVDYRTLPEIK